MFARMLWCGCVILYYVSLQRGQAERIRGNDLLDEYDDESDKLETEFVTDISSTGSVEKVFTDNNQTPSGKVTDSASNSTSSESFVWTDNSTRPTTDVLTDNSNESGTHAPTGNNATRSDTDIPIDNNVTRSVTDIPTDNDVTRSVSDIPTDPKTEISKTTASIVERFTVITTTKGFPATAWPNVCKNSSCPDLRVLTTTVSEGRNITLRCGSASESSPVWWYRDSTVLQQGAGEVVLHIVDSNQSHSGPYLCADEQGCCLVEHHVSVYGVPMYAYHLVVMGAILAVLIPLCVFLSVRHSSRLGRYARMFSERHGEEKHLIL